MSRGGGVRPRMLLAMLSPEPERVCVGSNSPERALGLPRGVVCEGISVTGGGASARGDEGPRLCERALERRRRAILSRTDTADGFALTGRGRSLLFLVLPRRLGLMELRVALDAREAPGEDDVGARSDGVSGYRRPGV